MSVIDVICYHGCMKLTKYQHACFTVEIDDQVLLVDPGNLTTDLTAIDNLLAVVVTHQHPDHCDPELLSRLVGDSTIIYGHSEVVGQLSNFKVQTVSSGETIQVGPFDLEFFGGDHAVIHQSIAGIANLGVIVNQTVGYPGDSFAVPPKNPPVLALPVAAPWMKIAEAIDYVNQLTPRLVLPTHDAILSDAGQSIVDRVISSNLQADIKYQRLVGELEL